MCRALEAFLLAQMPSNALLRLEAKAPGYVREPKKVKKKKKTVISELFFTSTVYLLDEAYRSSVFTHLLVFVLVLGSRLFLLLKRAAVLESSIFLRFEHVFLLGVVSQEINHLFW